jgi:hypothetical protein
MPKEKNDLRDRTKDFALRIMRMFSSLPKQLKHKRLVSRRCDLARPLGPIIAKRIAAEAKPNLSPSVAIRFASWRKLAIGLSSWLMAKLSNQPSFQLFAKNAMN